MADIAVVVAQVFVTSLLQLNSAMSGLALLVEIGDLTRMDPVEQNHDKEHQGSIENVKVYLVTEKVSSVALNIFDYSEDASNENERTRSIQDVEVAFPGQLVDSFA